jgi:hypothetical protein
MKKKALSDLTKEEIGQLFPIEISPYDSNWPKLYEKERQLIEKNINLLYFLELNTLAVLLYLGYHPKIQ